MLHITSPVSGFCIFSPRKALIELRPGHRREHDEDREGGEQQPVHEAVHDPPPGDCPDELEPVRARCRVLRPQDHDGEQAADGQPEPKRPRPATHDGAAQVVAGRSRPRREQRDDGDRIDAVVQVAVDLEHVGEEERHEERQNECTREPGPVSGDLESRSGASVVRANGMGTHRLLPVLPSLAKQRSPGIRGSRNGDFGFSTRGAAGSGELRASWRPIRDFPDAACCRRATIAGAGRRR
jgi:hypothetical protein